MQQPQLHAEKRQQNENTFVSGGRRVSHREFCGYPGLIMPVCNALSSLPRSKTESHRSNQSELCGVVPQKRSLRQIRRCKEQLAPPGLCNRKKDLASKLAGNSQLATQPTPQLHAGTRVTSER